MQSAVEIGPQENKRYSHRQIQMLFERLLTRAENEGYPFAAVRLDSSQFKDNEVEAKVQVQLNDQFKIERIKVNGDLKLSSRYLHHYLDLNEGDLFAKDKILRARARLQELNFVDSYQDPMVDFLGTGATLNLYLNKKNANQLTYCWA